MTNPGIVTGFDRALFCVAAAFNWLVALGLTMPGNVAQVVGMPPPEQTLFVHLFLALVALFGVAYFWIALDPSGKDALIAIAVIGKLSVFCVVVGHYLTGSVPIALPLLGSGDLLFAVLFLRFLLHHRAMQDA